MAITLIPAVEDFETAESMLIENWSSDLHAWSFHTKWIELTFDEQRALLALFGDWDNLNKSPVAKVIRNLSERIHVVINAEFPLGCFVKIGARSPKDSVLERRDLRCLNSGDVLTRITNSERMYEELFSADSRGELTKLYLRDWHDILPESEFRVFSSGGRLIAISQAEPRKRLDINRKRVLDIIETCWSYGLSSVLSKWKTVGVVLDVWVRKGQAKNALRIIDVNPMCQRTFPGLFTWEEIEQLCLNKQECILRVVNKELGKEVSW